MREILFRAKRVDDGEWVEGDLRQDRDMKCTYISGWDYCISETGWEREPFEYEVVPETVGQFTGLADKDGRKIFEGDIVSTDLKRPYAITIFKDGCFEYELDDGDGIYYDIMVPILEEPTIRDNYAKVIGNIHDNPTLREMAIMLNRMR